MPIPQFLGLDSTTLSSTAVTVTVSAGGPIVRREGGAVAVSARTVDRRGALGALLAERHTTSA